MTRRTLLGLALLATALLAFAGTASATLSPLHPAQHVTAAAKKTSNAPTVTKVTPSRLKVGEKLYVYGKNFRPGKGKTKVFFLRVGHGGAAWVRADKATKTKITVTVPTSLQRLLPTTGAATRFQIRVLTSRFSKVLRASRSPLITGTPAGGAGSGVIGPNGGTAGCTPNPANPAADSDGDGLSDQLEKTLGTDPCSADSDGDGVPDGYEYGSALDLNRTAGTSAIPYPYPGKRPYPNPLDPTDPNTDYDGDGLTLLDEYQGSKFLGWVNDVAHLPYSDGTQHSGAPQRCGIEVSTAYCDYAVTGPLLNGNLSDDERDADGDGLPNWDELYGAETQGWWTSAHKAEHPYPIAYPNPNWLDRDSDGDGILDGADDTDHDGYTNIQEIDRTYADSVFATLGAYDPLNGLNDGATLPGGQHAVVNPDNPCLPDVLSAACMKHPPFNAPPAPFDGSVTLTWPNAYP